MAKTVTGKEVSLADFTDFARKVGVLIAGNEKAYVSSTSRDINNTALSRQRTTYSEEDIRTILDNGSTVDRKDLSIHFFKHNSMYKRIILHYASFLTYQYICVPHTPIEDGFKDKKIMQIYDDAVDFLTYFQLENKCAYFTYKVLVEGAYYGLIKETNGRPVLMDLPIGYCRSRFKNENDVDMVEFDLSFFDTIRDVQLKKQVLDTYPKYVQKEYRQFKKKREKRWIFLNPTDGVHFNFYEEYPFFLDLIPLLNGYDELSEINKRKRQQEVSKILVSEMPITTQGELVFEPIEGKEMHEGIKKMLEGNVDVTPLTTFTKTHIESLQDSNSAENNYANEARKEIFGVTGTSDEIFTPTSSGAIPYYLQNTLSFMRVFSRQYQQFFTVLINRYFSSKDIRFNIIVPPISHYNTKEFIADAFKLASSGYSFFMPCMAMGVGQRDLRDLKLLEATLGLRDILEPLHSSYTESSKSQGEKNETAAETKTNKNVENTGGAPTKDNPTEKTIQNRENA